STHRPGERWHTNCSRLLPSSPGSTRPTSMGEKGCRDDAKQGSDDGRRGGSPRRRNDGAATWPGVLRADRKEGRQDHRTAPRLGLLRADRKAGWAEGEGTLRAALLRPHRKD